LLSAKEKELLRNQIIAKPHLYIGQEQVSFSTLPAFIDQHIEPRNAVLRSFVVANADGYVVMPGGLTRVARQKDNFVVSNQAGGISKDTWVLATEPDKPMSLWSHPIRKQLLSGETETLTSRAADNLFWVGRHLERIDATSRLLRTVIGKYREALEFKDGLDSECLIILLRALTQVTGTYPGFVKDSIQLLKMPEPELLALAKDGKRPGTLSANIQALVHAAYSIRDLWSQDTWRSMDNIRRRWQQRVTNSELTIESLQHNLDDLITGIVAFTGLTNESMTRESAWLMLNTGRRLERALALVALLRSTLALRHDDVLQNQMLEAVLVSTDSLTIYQRRYRSVIQLPLVLELLLLDESHPRSLAYQFQQLSTQVAALPRIQRKSQLSAEERLILKAYTDLRLCSVLELTQVDEDAGVYIELDRVLAQTTQMIWQISDVIAEAYFSHAQTSRLVANANEDEL